MDREAIQKTLDYIDEHLITDICAEELSRMAGFSLSHFYRLFQSAVGMPVMQYISRRRLLYAIYEIGMDRNLKMYTDHFQTDTDTSAGERSRKMIDVALEYGFETYAGFYKSFVREIGYTRGEYLSRYRVRKPYRINIIQEEHILMSPKKIKEILKYWGMENERISDVVYAETGAVSDHAKYVGDKYVLKYTANPGTAKKTVDIADALESTGLLSAQVVPALDGRRCIEEESVYYVLGTRLDGQRIKASALYEGDQRDKARLVGEIVGQLSIALAKIDVPVDELDVNRDIHTWAVPAMDGMLNIDRGFLNSFLEKFDELYPGLPAQIIHRDPNPGNIIMNGDKWGFIDFDLSKRSVRIYDPCYAASAILSETFETGNDERCEKWITILQGIMYGYDSVVKISEREKEAVPYILLANQFIAAAWFAGKEKYQAVWETNIRMTEWMCRNFDRLKV